MEDIAIWILIGIGILFGLFVAPFMTIGVLLIYGDQKEFGALCIILGLLHMVSKIGNYKS